jgi:quercetin dioxygenase-like cupin family protein
MRNELYKASWQEMEKERMTDLIYRQTVHGDNGTLARIALAPGAVVARHFHPNEQYSAILSGAMSFIFDDREVVVRGGEMIFIPANVPHSAIALEESVNLEFFAPRREDWIRNDDAYLRQPAAAISSQGSK